jgi:hypothetical protein
VDAQFLGYSRDSRDKLAAPVFRYRVGKNLIENLDHDRRPTAISRSRQRQAAAPQILRVQRAAVRNASVSAGKLEQDRWTSTRRQGRRHAARLDRRGRQRLASRAVKLLVQARTAEHGRRAGRAAAGYSIENYYPPKDNYGRDQLFEALGLAVTKDGTIVVATRTAGIWRIVNGEWRCSPKACSTVSAWWPRTRRVSPWSPARRPS